MEKQLTITVPNASGEEGLTLACKRGELFRHHEQLDQYYSQGYRIHDYTLLQDQRSNNTSGRDAVVRVHLKK